MTVIRAAGLSDCGRSRAANQDHYLLGGVVAQSQLWSVAFDEESLRRTGLLCAVADGLGGHLGGEVASRLALETLAESAWAGSDGDGIWLGRLLARAHEKLVAVGEETPDLKGLSTTIVGAYVREGDCTVFHAGDSRLYRYRDGFLNQLTEDHASAAAASRFDKSYQARSSSAIYNCLGGTAADRFTPTIQAGVPLRGGDALLLCSDGLTDAIPDPANLEALLAGHAQPGPRVRALIEAANAAGGPDNVTIVIVEVD